MFVVAVAAAAALGVVVWETQTGKLAKLDNIHNDPNAKAISLLTSVMGVGPAGAAEYVRKGITTLDQLRKQPNLTHQVQLGLKYYDDLQERIPRAEMDQLAAYRFDFGN